MRQSDSLTSGNDKVPNLGNPGHPDTSHNFCVDSTIEHGCDHFTAYSFVDVGEVPGSMQLNVE
jgi:hypothetical protein